MSNDTLFVSLFKYNAGIELLTDEWPDAPISLHRDDFARSTDNSGYVNDVPIDFGSPLSIVSPDGVIVMDQAIPSPETQSIPINFECGIANISPSSSLEICSGDLLLDEMILNMFEAFS